MKACAGCLRVLIGDEWQTEKLPGEFYMVKPYLKVKYEICPECEKMRFGDIITICCNCYRLKNDAGAWVDIDIDQEYQNISHGICPECARELYPGLCD